MKLIEEIQSRLEICAKATAGPWMLDHQSCFIFTQESDGSCGDMVLEIRGYGSGKPGKANGEFTVASRNQREGELAALKVALEKLNELDQTLRVPAAEYVPAIADAFTIIDQALAQINKLLSEGK